jgi:medium-chain acyl-[acyl-carrier-protein] hydrolase
MTPGPPLWRETFRIRSGEIGPAGRLRLPALCDLLQEAAGNHAAALGFGSDALLARGRTWVLSRLRLEVEALPSWREDTIVETWPSGVHRLWALREFRVTGKEGNALARATSGWLTLAVPSKRPLRPATEVAEVAAQAPPRLIEDSFEPLAGPQTGTNGPSFRVTRYDLDLNAHANNVAIVRALFEALPSAAEPPLTLEADFRGEAFEGDVLASHLEDVRGTTRVALIRERDDKEVARAVIAHA